MPRNVSTSAQHPAAGLTAEKDKTIPPGRCCSGHTRIYNGIIDLYLPLIGSDAFALYAVYLRFRHGNRETHQAALLGYAWPGDRRACRLLGWSRGAKKGKPNRIQRARQVLIAAGLLSVTTVGELLDKGVLTPEQARTLAPRASTQALRHKQLFLVHPPLERETFLREKRLIQKRLAELEERPQVLCDTQGANTDDSVHRTRPLAQSVRQGSAHPVRQKQTDDKKTKRKEVGQDSDSPCGPAASEGPGVQRHRVENPASEERTRALLAFHLLHLAENVLHRLDGRLEDRRRAREIVALWEQTGLEAETFGQIVEWAEHRAREKYPPGSLVRGFFIELSRLVREYLPAAVSGGCSVGSTGAGACGG